MSKKHPLSMVTYRLADVFDIIYIISFSKQTDL